jgi:hypothetical protein
VSKYDAFIVGWLTGNLVLFCFYLFLYATVLQH